MKSGLRIASLLASGTEIVDLLGLGDQLVAISHECDYPPRLMDRPRVTRAVIDKKTKQVYLKRRGIE
ncbi:MAG: hypothetical protein IH987_04990 [Planctomycetes bacterium]|nr:hypothetical protein [Planctomycetota bacterium]